MWEEGTGMKQGHPLAASSNVHMWSWGHLHQDQENRRASGAASGRSWGGASDVNVKNSDAGARRCQDQKDRNINYL
jgi:hypothetical protein